MLCASHQSQPAVQLPFGRLHSNLALVSFVPEVELSIRRGVALVFVSVNVMGVQGTMAFSRQAMAATTTSYFVYEAASIAQEHVERDTAVEVLQLHHVGGMQSTGSTVQGYLSPGTAVDLTWLLVCVRFEADVCYVKLHLTNLTKSSAGETLYSYCSKKNLNASKLSEHPTSGGKCQNAFCASHTGICVSRYCS